ncbi:MAG TPA: ABC transporter permease [Terriglobales bacterium]
MKKLRAFLDQLTGWFRRRSRERDLREEFESHLQLHIDDNIRAGLSPNKARRQALIKFGGLETAKESVRSTSRMLWMEHVLKDLFYAARILRRNPGFAATAILSLALGIGSSVAIFTVADNLLLRPLPYPDASRLVMVWETNSHTREQHNVVSPANYLDWKAQNTVFTEMAGFFAEYHAVFSHGERNEELDTQVVSSDLLPLLQVQPFRGRFFTREEDQSDARVAVISYRLWQRWFNGDGSVVGRVVQINSRPFTIVGVLGPDFYFQKRSVDLWLTLGLKAGNATRMGRWLQVLGRLKPGTTVQQAQTQMTGIAGRLSAAYPENNTGWSANVEPLRDSLVRQVKTSLFMLLAAVALLLGVACANMANLLLARYTVRHREMAVRGALGASRSRIVGQLLIESLVLALAGGFLGIAFAYLAVRGVMHWAPQELTKFANVSFDLRVLGAGLAISMVTGIVFGLLPAYIATRKNLRDGLHANAVSGGGDASRGRTWLVGAEVAASVVLLAGAGLLFRSLVGLQAVDPGLDPKGVLTFRVSLPGARYSQPEQSVRFFQQASEKLAQIPGVESAGAVSYLPFNGMAAGTDFRINGRPPAKPGEGLGTVVRTVLPGYFRTLNIPITRGRDFTNTDNVTTAPLRFIVNEALVDKYLRGEDPLTKSISVDMAMDGNPMGEIVGVVANQKEGSLDKEAEPTAYYVHAHLPYTAMVFVLRGHSAESLVEPARKTIQEIDPQQPIADVRLMEDIVRETFARQRLSAGLLVVFSLASLLLASIGIYGILAYYVASRTREIGVRVALGAAPGRILRLVVGSGIRMVIFGAAAGLGSALLLSGLVKGLLFGVGPRDPLSFVVAPALLMGVAFLAAYIPARRAARISPVDALRAE